MGKDTEATLAARVAALKTALNTRSLGQLDPDEVHALAKARLANAEAERIELDIAAERRAIDANPDAPLVAFNWSVEEFTDANGDLAAIDLRLLGDGRAVQGRLSPYLAAALVGQLGQLVAKALAQPKRER